MNQKKITFICLAIGVLLVVGSALFMTIPAKAQCGSQASSCKNCHETQAQKPVNNDGTTWHSQHAFGDFCYLCHAGNNQATDKTAAHTGMVSPLSDVVANCQGCHPKDTMAKAQVYATILGVAVGTGSGTGTTTAQTVATVSSGAAQSSPTDAAAAVVPAADMVDYSQRYDEVALGKKPVNVGNIILGILLAALVLGGGFFVLRREGWLNIAFEDPKRVTVREKYPADLVDMLPGLGNLDKDSRRILKELLEKPEVASDLLATVDKLTHVNAPDEESASDISTEENEA